MTPPPPVLALDGVRVDRGGAAVLDVPSFRLAEREFVSLIGPNGSGKSTLLLTLMGLLTPARGALLFRGATVDGEAAVIAFRRRLALVLQEPMLFDTTVFENVAAGLRIRGLAGAPLRERVEAGLDRFRLAPLADRAARTLSGGEARRVSLARALVVDPEVLLLDEPFTGLDLPVRDAITADLTRALAASRVATVLVTHDRAEALRLPDRVVVMEGGAIVQSDRPAAVLRGPGSAFAARCLRLEPAFGAA